MSNHPTGDATNATRTQPTGSARNAIKHGLFTVHDFIRLGEEDEYAQTVKSLWSELSPDGSLEEVFTTEIIGATWRLRRCRLVEEAFGSVDDLDFDPMLDERTEKQQRSVDRARAQSHLILRRSIAELTKLQKIRFSSPQPAPDQPSPERTEQLRAMAKADFQAMVDQALAKTPASSSNSSFCKTPPAPAPGDSSFCKPKPATSVQAPRNAPCPCKSGLKYKRCCGNPARPVVSGGGNANGMGPLVKA